MSKSKFRMTARIDVVVPMLLTEIRFISDDAIVPFVVVVIITE